MKTTSPKTPKEINEARQLLFKSFKVIGIKKSELDFYLDRPDIYQVTIATINNKVVGLAIVQTIVGYLCWLCVDDKVLGLGVAKVLLLDVEKILKKNKVKFITLDTRNRFQNGIIMYLENGFKITGTYVGQDTDLMIRMQKKI